MHQINSDKPEHSSVLWHSGASGMWGSAREAGIRHEWPVVTSGQCPGAHSREPVLPTPDLPVSTSPEIAWAQPGKASSAGSGFRALPGALPWENSAMNGILGRFIKWTMNNWCLRASAERGENGRLMLVKRFIKCQPGICSRDRSRVQSNWAPLCSEA